MKNMESENNIVACSVGILTYNSAASIKKCLDSTVRFSEVIICDGGSTDDTLKIVSQYSNCKVIEQDQKFKYDNGRIADFSGVRNQTFDASTFDWFLFVDSDEYLSEEVVDEISQIIKEDKPESPKVFKMPHKYVINGNIIDCASVYPSYHLRFFHRGHVNRFVKRVHEKPAIKDEFKELGVLQNVTYMPTDVDYDALKKKHEYYLKIEKERHKDAGRKELLKAIRYTIRPIIGRIVKVPYDYLTCRGRRMPFKKEWYATCYLVRLTLVLSGLFLKSYKKEV